MRSYKTSNGTTDSSTLCTGSWQIAIYPQKIT